MKLRIPLGLAAVAAVTALGLSQPATAGTTGATLAITGGTLAITVPTDAGSLGTRPNTVGGGTISGPLGQVQVNDARSAAAGSGWMAGAASSRAHDPMDVSATAWMAFQPGTAVAAAARSRQRLNARRVTGSA